MSSSLVPLYFKGTDKIHLWIFTVPFQSSGTTWQMLASTSFITLFSCSSRTSIWMSCWRAFYIGPEQSIPRRAYELPPSDLQSIGNWAGPEIHHTAQNSPPQPGESQASPPDQIRIDGHVPMEQYLQQSVRDEPWSPLAVQHKKTWRWLYDTYLTFMLVSNFG